MLKLQHATPSIFSKRSGHIAAILDRYMLVWGGFTYRLIEDTEYIYDDYFPSSELVLYDTDLCHWSKKEIKLNKDYPLLAASGACAVILDKHLYVLCGHLPGSGHNSQIVRLLLNYGDAPSWELVHCLGRVPSPRDKFTCWTYNKKIYCFGGYGHPFKTSDLWLEDHGSFQHDESEYLGLGWNNQLLMFDPDTRYWKNPECKGDVPSPRAAHCAAVIDDTVYLFGGRHRRLRMNDLYSLELGTLTWLRLHPENNGPVPVGRSWCSLTAVSSTTLLLYGGYTVHGQPISDAWSLDVRGPTWTSIHVPTTWPRLWHTACLSNDGSVLIYGGCSYNIHDSSIRADHCGEVLELRTTPMSLCDLCMHAAFEHRECTKPDWPSLPKQLGDRLEAWFDSWVKANFAHTKPLTTKSTASLCGVL